VWAGFTRAKALSESEFGRWDQFAAVLSWSQGDAYLSPWQRPAAPMTINGLFRPQLHLGGQETALDAGSAVQAAVANADVIFLAYGPVGRISWIQ